MINWQIPQPLEIELPTLSTQQLPDCIAEIAAPIAALTQTPLDLAALAAFAMAAAATRGKITVRVKGDYKEALSVYVSTSLPSGNRKSAVRDLIVAPLIKAEKIARESQIDDYRLRNQRIKILDKQLNALQKGNQSMSELDSSIAGIQLEIEDSRPTPLPQYWIDDITPEALVESLAEQGSMALFDDEGGFLENLYRYADNGEPNQKAILQAYTGSAIRVNRKGKESIYCERTNLILFISAQPNALKPLKEIEAIRERGLPQRFLYAWPKSPLGTRSPFGEPLPEQWSANYEAKVFALLNQSQSGEHRLIDLAESDLDLFEQLANYLESLYSGESAAMAGFISKLNGNLIRLAAAATLLDDPQAKVIKRDHYQKLIDLADYFLDHARFVLSPELIDQKAMRVLAKVIEAESTELNTTEQQELVLHSESGYAGFAGQSLGECKAVRTKQIADSIKDQKLFAIDPTKLVRSQLEKLAKLGWLSLLPKVSSERGGRPSECWLVNPQALERFEALYGKAARD
jgi:hypothetical protein